MADDNKTIEYGKNAALMRNATILSVGIAVTIVIIKLSSWVLTDSLSLLSSLIDSFLDIAASLITFFAVRYSLQPADEDHRFGHGKAEDIAAFAQSAFIAGSGAFIIVEAVARFVYPQPVGNEMLGIWAMIASSLLTVVLLSYQFYVIKKTGSSAIKADSMHYQTDMLVNMVVITSFLILMYTDWLFIDAIFALFIALYIFKGAWKVGKGAFDNLMDKEFSDEDRKLIMDAVLENKEVLGIHDLRTRFSGLRQFIQFHLELKGSMTLEMAHNISDKVEKAVMKEFPNAEVLIHQDPESRVKVALHKGRVVPVHRR